MTFLTPPGRIFPGDAQVDLRVNGVCPIFVYAYMRTRAGAAQFGDTICFVGAQDLFSSAGPPVRECLQGAFLCAACGRGRQVKLVSMKIKLVGVIKNKTPGGFLC